MTENVANNVAQANSQDYVKKSHNTEENEPKTHKSLTEQWKKGELDRNKLYYYETPFMTTDSASGFWLSNTLDKEKDKIKILSEVPSYEEWKSLNEILDSSLQTNKALAHRLNLCKDLLKECQHYIVNTPVYPQGDDVKQAEIHKLVDKITEALK